MFEHGDSFQLSEYSFIDLEQKYKKGLRDASKLELAFHEYLTIEGVEHESVPSFSDFLDKNKKTNIIIFQ